MEISRVGDGQVVLLAGGGKVFTDIAARFVASERSIEEISDSPYSAKIVRNIIRNGHLAATEFDYYVFGVSGYSRVTETQLVRKRLASYLIKSGRVELKGKRAFRVVLPERVRDMSLPDANLSVRDILKLLEAMYDHGLELGIPEEELRYIKPQATEFRAIIGMNAHALLDWFGWRCCKKAQTEIRDLAEKMQALCKVVSPDLFANSGPRCVTYGYCPEEKQHPQCAKEGKYLSKVVALAKLQQ